MRRDSAFIVKHYDSLTLQFIKAFDIILEKDLKAQSSVTLTFLSHIVQCRFSGPPRLICHSDGGEQQSVP